MRLVDFELLQDIKIDFEWEVIQSIIIVESEPVNINEALENKVWVNAMNEEFEAIERNKTWELTILPQKKKVISVR